MNKPTTAPITLRLATEEDAPLVFKLMSGQNFLKGVGDRGIRTIDDARAYIRNRMDADLALKGCVNHVIIDSTTDTEVGTCSVHDREGVDGLDVGYAILEGHEGKGYATQAARKMVELAFETYRVDQVSAIANPDNAASHRVLEKVGFRQTGFLQLPNDEKQLKLYVLEREE